MEKINISIYEWMEDFDNQYHTIYERRVQLEKAVDEYNMLNNTTYSHSTTYFNYLSWLRDKNKPDM